MAKRSYHRRGLRTFFSLIIRQISNMVGMFRMQWLVAGAIAAVAGLIAYRTIVPRMDRRRTHDAGAVSADWLANHRNLPGE